VSTLPLNLKVGGLADGRTVVSVTAAPAAVPAAAALVLAMVGVETAVVRVVVARVELVS
jgi:hypothetical protein